MIRIAQCGYAGEPCGLPAAVADGLRLHRLEGLVGMARTLAVEWGRHGIRCNVVMPGLIATPKVLALSEAARKAMSDALPLGRIGEPAELAGHGRLPTVSGGRLYHGQRDTSRRRLRGQHREPSQKLAHH